ncbi:polysaccharide deacetylase family protein [Bradyrhizobium sp. ARR65]|uniref:polysaccharide deacetylase family protein n=1 Tax=Bradyrhizobium sp. ARR65 TaxID=1040989 RepID=UPI0009FC0CA0|nr:polysaccharide deacetylase family protein [Bradyrhizobium sp. ARR65]
MIIQLTAAALIAPSAYFSPWLWRRLYMRAIKSQLTRDRILCLTYDDGPSRFVTPKILDLLGRRAAKATFFMLGQSAQRFRDVADRIAQERHDIGCHSSKHLNAWTVAPWRAVADINAGYDQLSSWMSPNGLFRPPYGKMTLPTYFAVRRRCASTFWWTIDSRDTKETLPDPRQVAAALVEDGGGIVLMHDLDRSKERNEFVLETTSLLLDVADREKIKVRRLCELQIANRANLD